MVMTLLYHEEERKLSKAEGSERVLCTASPVTWSRDSRTAKGGVSVIGASAFAINHIRAYESHPV